MKFAELTQLNNFLYMIAHTEKGMLLAQPLVEEAQILRDFVHRDISTLLESLTVIYNDTSGFFELILADQAEVLASSGNDNTLHNIRRSMLDLFDVTPIPKGDKNG